MMKKNVGGWEGGWSDLFSALNPVVQLSLILDPIMNPGRI